MTGTTGTGIAVRAVSLVESGILVNGFTVTDLLSGFTVRSDDIARDPGPGVPVWRGSGVSLPRLEAVRELVSEVAAARAADPELTSPNPLVPRIRFPWGVGEPRSDVLVTGPDARTTAAYLRSVGLRARCVDQDAAVRLAADLEMARAELLDLGEDRRDRDTVGHGAPADPENQEGPDDGAWPDDPWADDPRVDGPGTTGSGTGRGDGPGTRIRPRWAVPVAVAAVVAVALLTLGALTVVTDTGDGTVPDAVAAPVSTTPEQPEDLDGTGDTEPPSVPDTPDPGDTAEHNGPGWRDPVRRGATGPDLPADRAAVPVTADLDGWTLREATEHREIWMSDDPDARILVAATPTPLGTQEQLDTRMLTALETAPELTVLSRSPVDYEETSPASTTRWQVRLIDGHQVSVGCQYREGTADATARRTAACDRFTATARVP